MPSTGRPGNATSANAMSGFAALTALLAAPKTDAPAADKKAKKAAVASKGAKQQPKAAAAVPKAAKGKAEVNKKKAKAPASQFVADGGTSSALLKAVKFAQTLSKQGNRAPGAAAAASKAKATLPGQGSGRSAQRAGRDIEDQIEALEAELGAESLFVDDAEMLVATKAESKVCAAPWTLLRLAAPQQPIYHPVSHTTVAFFSRRPPLAIHTPPARLLLAPSTETQA